MLCLLRCVCTMCSVPAEDIRCSGTGVMDAVNLGVDAGNPN